MAEKIIKTLRDFPSVEELLQDKRLTVSINAVPRPLAAEIVKTVVANRKKDFKKSSKTMTMASLVTGIEKTLASARRQQVQRVINATGIVVHTNLGRAPLPESLFDAVKETVTGYGNIEFDLERGIRGKRGVAAEKYLALMAGSEAATVVNNCAAALFLILNTFANRRNVLTSRGELIQIGGGFRIPDILKRSGTKLTEVGTTNITTLDDYRNGIDSRTALILKVHKSNFVQAGFTEEVSLKDLASLGSEHGLPVINDLGSGVFIGTRDVLGYAEDTVQQSVRAGADLTCFSGDKMLGGVQAGLIVGREEMVKKVKKNPLFRTMRVDKIVFSILEHLLTIYLNGNYQADIKLWEILSCPESELYKAGKAILKELGEPNGLSVEATKAYMGGGALPEAAIASVGIVFSKEYKASVLIRKFRELSLPIIGRVEDDRFLLDLKAVDKRDRPCLVSSIRKVLKQGDRV